MARTIVRQGDALFIKEEIPEGARLEKETGVMVRGETGNPHKLGGVKVYSSNGQVYLQVEEPRELTHPQHPTMLVPPGSYRVAKVGWKDVADSLFMPPQSAQAARTTPGD